jgi:hypothetical protein
VVLVPSTAHHLEAAVIADVHDAPTCALMHCNPCAMSASPHITAFTQPPCTLFRLRSKRVFNIYVDYNPTQHKSIYAPTNAVQNLQETLTVEQREASNGLCTVTHSSTPTFSCLGAVDKVPPVAVADDTAVLDQEVLALVLGLIQDTVRHLLHTPARIQVVVE